MNQREPLTINLEPDLYNFLKVLAEKQGIPLSVFVRKLTVQGLVQEISSYDSWKLYRTRIEDEENL